jgi:excisionase family DNA binding protein
LFAQGARKEAYLEQLLLSIEDTGKALSLGRSKVYGLISEGQLETVTIGRRRLVRATSVKALALGQAA